MSQDQNTASPADRVILRANASGAGDPYSMQNLNTSVLPNGALCWVTDVATLYALDKAASSGGVTPSAGPGRWLPVITSEGASSGIALAVSNASDTFEGNGTWKHATNPGFELDAITDTDAWALTALGCKLTYTGPTRNFLVVLSASLSIGGEVEAPPPLYLAVQKNTDPAVNVAPTARDAVTSADFGSNFPYSIGTSRPVSLASGDTVQPLFAANAGDTTAGISNVRMSIIPA